MDSTGGSKYVLNFSVEGSGKKQLDDIVKALKSVADQAGTGAAAGAIEEAAKAINELGANSITTAVRLGQAENKMHMMTMAMHELKAVGQLMQSVGIGIVGTFKNLGTSIMSSVSPVESFGLQMKVLGKMSQEQVEQTQANIQALVAATPFTTQELQGVTQSLVIGKIALKDWTNAAGGALTLNDEIARGFSKMDGAAQKAFGNLKVNATSVVADFAALTGNVGEKMQYFTAGLTRAFATKSAILLRDQLTPEALKALVGGAGNALKGTANDAMKRIYKYLQEQNAVGMAALASNTAEGVMSNFRELPEVILRAIGGKPTDPNSVYSKIKGIYMALFLDISEVINDPAWRSNIAKGFGGVIDVFKTLAGWVSKGAASTLAFAAAHPVLLKIATVSAVLLAILSAMAGTLIVLVTTVGLATVSWLAFSITLNTTVLPAIGRVIVATKAWMLTMLPWIAGAAVAALAVYSIYKALKHLVDGSPRLTQFFGGIKKLVTGLSEAFTNWGNGTTKISKKTADDLENSGMMRPFLKIIVVIRGAQKMLGAFWESTKTAVIETTTAFMEMFGLLSREDEELAASAVRNKDSLRSFGDTAELVFHAMVGSIGLVLQAVAGLNMAFVSFTAPLMITFAYITSSLDEMWRKMVAISHFSLDEWKQADMLTDQGYDAVVEQQVKRMLDAEDFSAMADKYANQKPLGKAKEKTLPALTKEKADELRAQALQPGSPAGHLTNPKWFGASPMATPQQQAPVHIAVELKLDSKVVANGVVKHISKNGELNFRRPSFTPLEG